MRAFAHKGQAQTAMLDEVELARGRPCDYSIAAATSLAASLISLPGNAISFALLRRAGFDPTATTESTGSVPAGIGCGVAVLVRTTINGLAAALPALTGVGTLLLAAALPTDEREADTVAHLLRARAAPHGAPHAAGPSADGDEGSHKHSMQATAAGTPLGRAGADNGGAAKEE